MAVGNVRRLARDLVPALVVSVAISLAAGAALATKERLLLTLPLLLAIIPPVNAASGMIGSLLGARVATALHFGSLFSDGARQFRRDMAAAALLAALLFSLLSLLAWLAAPLLGLPRVPELYDLGRIVMMTGAMMVVALLALTMILGTLSFHLGWDPDNTLVPILTSSADLLAILSLVVSIGAVVG